MKKYVEIAEFEIDYILKRVRSHAPKMKVGEYKVRLDSKRLRTFKKDGVVCKNCGLVANIFIAEKSSKDYSPHLNLYKRCEDGRKILFTKDHIIPKSKGGTDSMNNLQTMCEPCNCFKGDKIYKKKRERKTNVLKRDTRKS